MKHTQIYNKTDLVFISSDYEDIVPENIVSKKIERNLKKPIIQLQNNFYDIRTCRENGNSYDNNILRYLVYNKELKNNILENNKFNDYQLYYTVYPPKYGELLRKIKENPQPSQILWHFSSDNVNTSIEEVIEDKSLINYLKENNLKLKILTDSIENNPNNQLIEFINADCNIIDEIANSKLLISDYSSLIYDFSFFNKPYIIFQSANNNDKLNIVSSASDLISKVINEDYEKCDYIEKTLPKNKNFTHINTNSHIFDLYSYFKKLQENKITFIGYNFYGIGGTVNATMALAESLMQNDYFVELISLKKTKIVKNDPPNGLNIQYLTWDDTSSLKEKFKRRTHRSVKYYHYLQYDNGKKYVHPYAGYALDNLMKQIKSKTVVSTREPLHLFLKECSSEYVKKKIYFFHALSDIIDDIYPNLMNELKKIQLEKAIFITNQNRLAIKDKFNYDNYKKYEVLGNSLTQSKILDRDEISSVSKKSKYRAIYLLRISEDRSKDIENLLEFGKYVQKNNIDFIEIDVFGGGDYVSKLKEQIEKNNLENIIHYNPPTSNAIDEIRNHDFMIDFSLNQSFGMTYIEGVLNGKKVFCMKNLGSGEVMENIPNSYIKSFEWLCNQIKEIHKISSDELKSNYDTINEKYSQKTIANKFLDFLD